MYENTSLTDRVVEDIKEIIKKKKPKEESTLISEETKVQDSRKEEIKRTMDGHYVKSDAECVIDDILYENRIVHCYEKKVPISADEPTIMADWFIPIYNNRKGIYIEYWGMKTKEYLENKERKLESYKMNNIPLISIEKDDYREIKFKTINGNSIMGEGNITIEGGEGGSTAGVEAINIGQDIQDWTQKTGVVSIYTKFYDGSYDVNIGGMSFYGLKPIDDSIVLENAGGTVNGNFRCGIKVNEDNFKTINGESIFGKGDITIEGGGSSEEIPTVQTGDTGTSSNYIYSDATPKNGVVAFISNQRSGDGKGTYSGITYRYWNDVASNRFVTLDWTGTQAQYDALGEYSDYITYNIIEDEE